jgi:hypothetical protein
MTFVKKRVLGEAQFVAKVRVREIVGLHPLVQGLSGILRHAFRPHIDCESFVLGQISGLYLLIFSQLVHPNFLRTLLQCSTPEKIHIKYIFILYYDQQMHNYFTNYHTPTCFDTIVSSSGSL